MSVFDIGGDYVAIALKQEDLEDSINGLSQLKSILQAAIDVKTLGKHFDTAIDAMTMLLSGFDDYREGQQGERYNYHNLEVKACSG